MPSVSLVTSFQVRFITLAEIVLSNPSLGQWEFVKKGEAPVVGITKLEGVTLEELKRPRRQIAPVDLLAASSPTSVTEPGSKADASRA
jgi:hypothetical protein